MQHGTLHGERRERSTRSGGRSPTVNGCVRPGRVSVVAVTVLFATHAAYLDHLAGPRHPERPERLTAVLNGATKAGLADALVAVEPVAATREDLERVHPARYLDRIEGISLLGGGRLDPDTYASAGSWNAAVLAAGAGLTAVRELQAGRGDSAFCAVRPPGHHATMNESMGFCFVNNVAVVAASLAAQGERVLMFDYDAHHGNGTQRHLLRRPSGAVRQHPSVAALPGYGSSRRGGRGRRPRVHDEHPGATGRHGRRVPHAFDHLVAPRVDAFAPTWVLISAGFDAHRATPSPSSGWPPATTPRSPVACCRWCLPVAGW